MDAIRNGRFFVLAREWKRPRMGLNRENTEMMARRRNATAVAGRSGESGDDFGSSQAWPFSPLPRNQNSYPCFWTAGNFSHRARLTSRPLLVGKTGFV